MTTPKPIDQEALESNIIMSWLVDHLAVEWDRYAATYPDILEVSKYKSVGRVQRRGVKRFVRVTVESISEDEYEREVRD